MSVGKILVWMAPACRAMAGPEAGGCRFGNLHFGVWVWSFAVTVDRDDLVDRGECNVTTWSMWGLS